MSAVPQTMESWLKARKNFLGASDCATALGHNPYKTPLTLWEEKTGLREPENLDDKEPVLWGKLLEPLILAEWARRRGRALEPAEPYRIRVHPQMPWLSATLDGVSLLNGDPWVVEAKTAGSSKLKAWDAGPPLPYQIQVQLQLLVTGWQKAAVAVLVGGWAYRDYEVARNDKFLRWAVPKLADFWQHVQDRTPPEAL